MSRNITRRRFIKAVAGVTTAAVGVGGAAMLVRHFDLVPPDHDGILGIGNSLTYAGQRLLLHRQPLAREFSRDMISKKFPAINTILPEDEEYRRDMENGFRQYKLAIDGMVSKPMEFSLDDLRRFPSRTQVTEHICEQGWSAIAEWTGVPLASVLEAAGIQPNARFAFFNCVDGWWDSLDMADILHPQTLLTYGMNGQALPVPHGAPVRLRVERQIGYKNLKYVSTITITDTPAEWGDGKGSQGAEHGYSWYAGI